MCWSPEASVAVAAVGAVATAITYRRGDSPAIWITLGFFTLMEGLQVWGYTVLDQCGSTSNQAVTMASFLHIALQPIIINAFAMELVPASVKLRIRYWIYGVSAAASVVTLLQLIPSTALGSCMPGSALCAERLCTVAGNWHIAWDIPYNGLLVPFELATGTQIGFPAYMAAVFLLPLIYGAWRFVLVHLFAGPVLASVLTNNPNEMPAIWCLFSIAIIFVALSPAVRRTVETTSWWGRKVPNGP